MRRRDPTDLTDRERDVLELLRRDFTNEQIAERFGISLDGAKYHVSQILSKLGVATREEAAAVELGERRRWWARWPLWAKIAGAATSAAALTGLALLAWGVVRTDDDERSSINCPPGTEIPDQLSTLRVTIETVEDDQLTVLRKDLEEPHEVRVALTCYTSILQDGRHIEANDIPGNEPADIIIGSRPEPPYDAVTVSLGPSRQTVLTPEQLYERVEDAVTRPGFVLHSTVELRQADENGVASGEPKSEIEFWTDASHDRMLYKFRAAEGSDLSEAGQEVSVLFVNGTIYSRTGDQEVSKTEAPRSFCPGTEIFLLSVLLLCAHQASTFANPATYLQGSQQYEGVATVVLGVEESRVTTLGGAALPPPTGGSVAPVEPARSVETRNVARIHIASDTFLPVARIYEIRENGKFHDASAWIYRNKFVALDNLPGDFFDPSSIGYTG